MGMESKHDKNPAIQQPLDILWENSSEDLSFKLPDLMIEDGSGQPRESQAKTLEKMTEAQRRLHQKQQEWEKMNTGSL